MCWSPGPHTRTKVQCITRLSHFTMLNSRKLSAQAYRSTTDRWNFRQRSPGCQNGFMKRSTKLIACLALLNGSLAFYGCGGSQTNTTAQENPSLSGSANRVNPSGSLSSGDADFIQKAAKGG